MEAARHAVTRAAVAGTAVVGFTLVAWASLDDRLLLDINPRPLPRLTPRVAKVKAPTGTPTTSTTPAGPVAHHWDGTAWVGGVLAVLFWGFVLGVVVLLVVRLLRRLPRFAAPAAAPEPGEAQPLLAVPDAEQHLAVLHEGTPRNGIVAAWADLERAVAAAGFPRRPHETSSELVMRVLGDADVPAAALTGLNSLYREARFSQHDVTEERRAQAAAYLADVHAALGPRAGEEVAP